MAKEVLQIPGMSAKWEKIWKPANHTNQLEAFIAHEMAKHGFLSLWYFVAVLEAASLYFDEHGNFILLKEMVEMGYVNGRFNCKQFQSDVSKRLGCQIRITYEKKKNRLYPRELGVLFAGDFTRISYLLAQGGIGQKDQDVFYLDGIDAPSHMDQ